VQPNIHSSHKESGKKRIAGTVTGTPGVPGAHQDPKPGCINNWTLTVTVTLHLTVRLILV